MYHQLEEDLSGNTAVDILHLFGRTYGTPRNYYYRQRVNKSYWTAWDRVDLYIEGDHLIPVVWTGGCTSSGRSLRRRPSHSRPPSRQGIEPFRSGEVLGDQACLERA